MHDEDATNPLIGRPGSVGPDSDDTIPASAPVGGGGPPTRTDLAPIAATPSTSTADRTRFARRRGTLIVGTIAFGFLIGTLVAIATAGGETTAGTKPVSVPKTVAPVASSAPTTQTTATTTTLAVVSVQPTPGTVVVVPTVPTTADPTPTTAPPPPPDPASG